jgi:hypothetical protein
MTSNAILYRMPAGIAGDVTRREQATVEPQIMDPTTPVLVFGVPVKMVSGKIKPLAASGDAIYGFLCRPYPVSAATSEALGTATPSTVLEANILRRGYMTVNVQAGVVAKDGQVYFNDTTGHVEGLTSAPGQTAISGCKFMGAADSDGNVEISYNL